MKPGSIQLSRHVWIPVRGMRVKPKKKDVVKESPLDLFEQEGPSENVVKIKEAVEKLETDRGKPLKRKKIVLSLK